MVKKKPGPPLVELARHTLYRHSNVDYKGVVKALIKFGHARMNDSIAVAWIQDQPLRPEDLSYIATLPVSTNRHSKRT